MDRKSLVVVALCFLLILFWQPAMKMAGLGHYLEGQRRGGPTTTAPATPGAPSDPAPAPSAPGTAAAPRANAATTPATPAVPERTYVVETPLYRAVFSNHGARLVSLELKQYASAHDSGGGLSPVHPRGQVVPEGHRVVLAGGGPVVGLDLGSGAALRPLDALSYDVAESTDAAGAVRALTFTARDSSGLALRQVWRVRPNDYAFDVEVDVRGVPASWRIEDYSLTMRSWPQVTEHDLQADHRMLRSSSMLGKNIRREGAGGLVKGSKSFDGAVRWASVQSRYFIAAAAVQHGVPRGVHASAVLQALDPGMVANLPRGTRPEQPLVSTSLTMSVPGAGAGPDRFVVYVGPSEYFRLAGLKVQLERVVDMGWNWLLPISTILLKVMNLLFGALKNYGVTILVLATLVRVLLHPLNMSSIKSMRAMQRLQPEIERIREKYKDDPQALNTAMMAIYKENKVNPAGGCLPMLLQMPLFLALYQVLFNAIELRQAPFVAWMTDLSAPDVLFQVAGFPIRLLPLLMAGSGFLQQKMTPTDPRQAPTMYMMNIMMLVFFYNLPSGLVLYWTWMNVLTAVQQWIALRSDGAVVSSAVVVEERGGSKGRKKDR
jgi:YidC/Oxa1 family membrane protein insertase